MPPVDHDFTDKPPVAKSPKQLIYEKLLEILELSDESSTAFPAPGTMVFNFSELAAFIYRKPTVHIHTMNCKCGHAEHTITTLNGRDFAACLHCKCVKAQRVEDPL
jgi:hypothetical protein